jgi:hypothetical protein
MGLISATGAAATAVLAGLDSTADLVTFFAGAEAVAKGFFLVFVFLTGFMVQFLVWIYSGCPFPNS